ncbi:hypothetical protein B296_00050477 [Ensete ventricosum]|uniref:Uncharacterized protein n=1 Tax=Ensete ventricosum TaxID=4639 RepID=A0A426Y951_ENSVE|nr:hypothetical protein B296_00050477 [Ensete ventricosum]
MDPASAAINPSSAAAITSTLLVMLFLIFCFFFLFLYLLCSLLPRGFAAGRAAPRKLPLPPGSMGWPYVGETFQLYSNNPDTFFALKQKRSVAFLPSLLVAVTA